MLNILWISVITMESDPVSFGDSLGNYCMFYNTPALLNDDREREFGTVIAESRNKLIIVDDEILKMIIMRSRNVEMSKLPLM